MTPTSTAIGTAQLSDPPAILDGQVVYDMLMQNIEPDLVTAQLPLLKEKYKDETPEQAKERAERYDKAFVEYDRQYVAYMAKQEQSLASYQHMIMGGMETRMAGDESDALTAIESSISLL